MLLPWSKKQVTLAFIWAPIASACHSTTLVKKTSYLGFHLSLNSLSLLVFSCGSVVLGPLSRIICATISSPVGCHWLRCSLHRSRGSGGLQQKDLKVYTKIHSNITYIKLKLIHLDCAVDKYDFRKVSFKSKNSGIPKTSQDADFEDRKLGIEIEGAFVYHTMVQFGFLCIFNPVLNGNFIPD